MSTLSGIQTMYLLGDGRDEEGAGPVARGHVHEASDTNPAEKVADIRKRPKGVEQRMRHQDAQSRRAR